ncbi:J domain-containing protein [Magnetospirillum sp. UT-4]|uniref:J domain-containing protein n=1 Tax=Magnetospirillum sp. UT-4 TaxID=2681467 RepID=UPI001384F454|nr:J domain-containing protein [Magnetospirillum sp. UT-4]CAA7623762.1 Chaperone DnaJ [Magnetospirillum sp. UT-4]
MRNPYDILGVAKTAGEDDIRKAFRKLAKQSHPDLHPGDAGAEARFRELNGAYDLLSDPVRRARFDRGEIDGEGRETFTQAHAQAQAGPGGFGAGFERFRTGGSGGAYHFSFGGDSAEEVFSHLFGENVSARRAAGRGRDLRHALTVPFADAALGARRRLTLADGRSLDVTIPAGLKDGQTLRLKGQGEPGPGGAGDLLLEVGVEPHRLFRRVGDDLHLDLPVTLPEAVEGARVRAPTLTGAVTLTVPPGSNTGTVLRLRGKGIKGADLYVTLKVVLPERIDDDLAAFVARWGRDHPYDPRAGL